MIQKQQYERTSGMAKTFQRRLEKAGFNISDLVSMDIDYEEPNSTGGYMIHYKTVPNEQDNYLELHQEMLFDPTDVSREHLTSIWDTFTIEQEIAFHNKNGLFVNCSIGENGKVYEIDTSLKKDHEFYGELSKIKKGMHYTNILDVMIKLYLQSPVANEPTER